MTSHNKQGGRARVCRDRCEVCDAVITARPVAKRRRCADHLDQLALVPVTAVKRPGRARGSEGAMSGDGLMAAHLVWLVIVIGTGVLGWVLHELGKFLKRAIEVAAVIAVVFFTAFAAAKAAWWVARTVGRCWRTSLIIAFTIGWCVYLGWLSLALTVGGLAGAVGVWWLTAWRGGVKSSVYKIDDQLIGVCR
jgi:hypothetical protein